VVYALPGQGSLIEGLADTGPYYLGLRDAARERHESHRDDLAEVMKRESLKQTCEKSNEAVLGKEYSVKKAKERFKIGSVRSRGRARNGEK
jgi:hypothetical protein